MADRAVVVGSVHPSKEASPAEEMAAPGNHGVDHIFETYVAVIRLPVAVLITPFGFLARCINARGAFHIELLMGMLLQSLRDVYSLVLLVAIGKS